MGTLGGREGHRFKFGISLLEVAQFADGRDLAVGLTARSPESQLRQVAGVLSTLLPREKATRTTRTTRWWGGISHFQSSTW